MLRKHQQFFHQVLQIIDAFVLAGALCLAHEVRIHIPTAVPGLGDVAVGPLGNYLWLFFIILPFGPLLLEFQGFYRIAFPQNPWITLGRILRGVFYLWLLLLGVIVFSRIPSQNLSRAVLLFFVPIAVLLLLGRNFLFRAWYLDRNISKNNRRSVMLCGSSEQRLLWKERLAAAPNRQLVVQAEIDLKPGFDQEFIAKLHSENVEIVIFELNQSQITEINLAIKACEAEGVEAWVTADFITTTLARPQFDEFLDRPLLVFRTTPDASWELLAKNVIDCLGALVLLVFTSPLLLLVAFAIFLTSGFPIFFSQMRSGRHGKPFRMYKFRTMETEAEQRQAELMAFNQMSGPTFKMDHDPRITRLGRLLRKFSLDEFPQLWNVLRGEMSLVGPRPLPVFETEKFSDYAQRRRLSVKPGLTCLWQVAGRNDITDFSDWVRLDLEYIDHWSLWSDVKILLRTIPVVLIGRGGR